MSRLAALLLALPLAAALCPQGAVQGTSSGDCYLYGSAQPWQQAEQYCAANKGHLSSVPNSFVNAFLISYPKALQAAQSYWLGAELKAGTAKWTWTDDNNFTYANWAAGEPKQGPGCLYTSASTGQWNSGKCDAPKPFICKVPSSCKPASQKCDDGWTFNGKLKKCFKTLSGVFNWDSAFAACREQDAHLPSIHDDAENLAFSEIARDYPLVILGMKNNAFPLWPDYPSYHYEWSDGSFVNYSQLQFADGEHLACVCFKTGQKGEKSPWVTMDCSKPTQMATAVCQKSPKEA